MLGSVHVRVHFAPSSSFTCGNVKIFQDFTGKILLDVEYSGINDNVKAKSKTRQIKDHLSLLKHMNIIGSRHLKRTYIESCSSSSRQNASWLSKTITLKVELSKTLIFKGHLTAFGFSTSCH